MNEKGKALTVARFFAENEKILDLTWLAGRQGGERRIREGSVNRAGLPLTGFMEHFADKRIQLIGMAENAYLASLSDEVRTARIRAYLEKGFPCLILARGLLPDPAFVTVGNERQVPVLMSSLVTYNVATRVTFYLERELAPSVSVTGSLVEVQGTGVLVRGESGVGKSECILSLLRRGAALVADDVARVSRLESDQLHGTAAIPEMRGYIEIRGLGLINVIQLFGIAAYRLRKEIDLVVTLKLWKPGDKVDRTGMEEDTYRILGVEVPHVTIPVAPGRETANLVELAAHEYRIRHLGVHAGRTLNDAIIRRMGGP